MKTLTTAKQHGPRRHMKSENTIDWNVRYV